MVGHMAGRQKPGGALVAVAAMLVVSGCVSVRLHETRAPLAGAEPLEMLCEVYPSSVTQMQEKLAANYQEGWRLAAVGEETTSYMFLSTARPVICLERRTLPGSSRSAKATDTLVRSPAGAGTAPEKSAVAVSTPREEEPPPRSPPPPAPAAPAASATQAPPPMQTAAAAPPSPTTARAREAPSDADVDREVDRLRPELAACRVRRETAFEANVVIKINTDGRVTDFEFVDGAKETPLARCIRGKLEALRFPPYFGAAKKYFRVLSL